MLTWSNEQCKMSEHIDVAGNGEMVELVDGTGLENRHRCKSVKGSNPFLSAKNKLNLATTKIP